MLHMYGLGNEGICARLRLRTTCVLDRVLSRAHVMQGVSLSWAHTYIEYTSSRWYWIDAVMADDYGYIPRYCLSLEESHVVFGGI